jgi:hypothetical protein
VCFFSCKATSHKAPSVEDVFDERDNPPSLSPHNPQHILEQTDSEEKEDDDPSSLAMDVELDDDEEDDLEEEEEDTEAELGMTSLSVYPKTKTSVAHLSRKTGPHQYMSSFDGHQELNIRKSVSAMYLNVQQQTAKHKLGEMFVDSWTPVMPNQPETCKNMQRSVGVLKRSQRQMLPSV